MVIGEKIFSDFKKSDQHLLIKEGKRPFNRYHYNDDHRRLVIDFLRKNEMGSELIKLTRYDDSLKNLVEARERLQEFCDNLCTRITYLPESFRLIELDNRHHTAQVRSYPPYIRDNSKLYFELIIDAQKGMLTLTRQCADAAHRVYQVSFVLNDELLQRLITDMMYSG